MVLLGGGEASRQDVAECLNLGERVVAVDGGLALAAAAGIVPDAVIGDFDSLAPDALSAIPPDRRHRIEEQDSTDFEKALSRVAAPVVIGAGFLGGRIDHQLAALHTLLALAHQPCVLLGAREILLLAPPRIALGTVAGETVSLFPLAEVTGQSSGLQWEIDGLRFAPGARIGTSNRATGPVTLQMAEPGMVLILPRRLIRPVVAALSQEDAARWPARAAARKDPPPR